MFLAQVLAALPDDGNKIDERPQPNGGQGDGAAID